MTRAELIELKNAVALNVFKCGSAIEENDTMTPGQERLVATFERIHAVICRELQIGRPAMRLQMMMEKAAIARICLDKHIGEDTAPPESLHQAHAWLLKAIEIGGEDV